MSKLRTFIRRGTGIFLACWLCIDYLTRSAWMERSHSVPAAGRPRHAGFDICRALRKLIHTPSFHV